MTQIQIRRDTEANWTSVNPTLALGEWGYDTTNKVCKIGDGTTPWNTLPVYGGESELPIATDTTAGIVKPDGSTITVTSDGTISATASGGTSDYTELTNKPKINSVELSGDVPLNNLDLYSQTEINNALGQKQDKLATQAPLKISSVTTTNQTNCTYINGTATALGTATGTGTCTNTDYLGENRMSVSGYNSTTDGVHINYPFSIASSAESALCYPLSYVYGYYNEDGKFVFLLNIYKRGENRTYYYGYSIAHNDNLVVNGSKKFITDITDRESATVQTSWSALNYSRVYCPDGLNIGDNLHIDFLQLTDDGTFTVFNQRTITLTDALITQLSKINIATYNITTNTEGETRTIKPIRDASGNIVFNGDIGGSITSNTLQLKISSQANNILEVETDGLYVPSQSYTLPVATTSTLGGVKPDGTSITITDDGVISAALEGYAQTSDIPTATSDLTNDSGFITNSVNNLTNYTLTSDLAAVATSGSYNDLTDKPTIPSEYVLPTASASVLGGVKIGNGVSVTNDGTLSVASVNGFKFWSGTQTAYNGIATKDPNTLYIITGE